MNAVLPFRVWITYRLPFYLGGAYLSAPTPKGADELVLALCANTEKDTYRKPQGFVVLFLFINNFSFSNERKISLESFLELKTFFVLVTFYFFTLIELRKLPFFLKKLSLKFANSKILLYLCI